MNVDYSNNNIYNGYVSFYRVNDILSMFMTLRTIILMRILCLFSKWCSSSAFRVCDLYASKNDTLFVIKCLFIKQPLIIYLTGFSIAILFSAFCFRVSERPLQRAPSGEEEGALFPANIISLDDYQIPLWVTIVTMPTVGYGDFYPTTDPGRFFMTFIILWGVAATSIMIVSVNSALTLNSNESKATNMMDMLEAHENVKSHSA